ncbi:MBL fold metallo-hydrolase, partial [Bacteroides thetaiotaomicron]
MNYKITTLVENCVYGRKLQAEHGLSLYIETPENRLLFDTGAS